MAILGGAGNVAGGNPAGTGTSLNYIGDRAYAYSGVVGVNGTETTLLEFTTGNDFIVGLWLPQILEDSHHGDDIRFACYVNDQEIMASMIAASTGTDLTGLRHFPIIVASFTTIKITGQNISQNLSKDTGATFTGRV